VEKNVKQYSLLYVRLKEAYLILAICTSAALLMALASYSSLDNSWLISSDFTKVQNFIGNIGAQIASTLLWLFGFAAYLIPILLTLFTVFLYREKLLNNKQQLFFILKAAGFLSLLCAIAGILNILSNFDNYKLPSTNGGVMGAALSASLIPKLNVVGTIVTLVSISMVAITVSTGLVWLRVITYAIKIGNKIIKRALFLAFAYMQYRYRIHKNSRNQMFTPIWQSQDLLVAETEDENKVVETPIAPKVKSKPKPQLKAITTILPSVKTSRLTAGYLPPIDLLYASSNDLKIEHYSEKILQTMSHDLKEKLQNFGIEARVCGVSPGPVITRFELDLAPGMKASKVSGLAKDLARQLAVPAVRVIELIPGKSVVGLEIPNQQREIVRMRDIIESKWYQDSTDPLTLALGKDIAGKPLIANLARMPHLLVAGATGSGKSVAINVMLLSLLYKTTPADVRLLLIDPKMLELAIYDGIPHLLTPVVTDMTQAASALRWCVNEMERRYKLMADLGVRNIDGYNEKVLKTAEADKLPFIVIMIDEFADLIISVGKVLEDLITRITQKARAAGIHVILATQRPSVDVITGLIKANVPTRIAFQVASRIDSRTILDQQGAEQLLGHGDSLYLAPGTGIPIRVHGALVQDDEVHAIVEAIKNNYGEPEYLLDLSTEVSIEAGSDCDALYETAVQIVLDSRKTSISHLQRKLKIGYNRSARLIEEMENAGILSQIGPNGLREIM
jgi:S-DNA-T family DNA segregation ATPase FtsK/SpoIIIE